MNILSLDLGTTTGWATSTEAGIVSGTWVHDTPRQRRFEGGGMRFLRFRKNLLDLDRTIGGVDLLVFETVRQRSEGLDAIQVYGGFLSVLTAFCEDRGIPYEGVPVGTIKLHATGKGNASKHAIINAVKKKGHQPTDDNEADAIALLYWAKEEYAMLE